MNNHPVMTAIALNTEPTKPSPLSTLAGLKLRTDLATDKGMQKLKARHWQIQRGQWLEWPEKIDDASIRMILAKGAYADFKKLDELAARGFYLLCKSLATGKIDDDTRLVAPFTNRYRQKHGTTSIIFDVRPDRNVVMILSVSSKVLQKDNTSTVAES